MNITETNFQEWIKTEIGQACLNSVNVSAPYNSNILWWAFTKGYERGFEDAKDEKFYNATKNLKTAHEKRKEKISKK